MNRRTFSQLAAATAIGSAGIGVTSGAIGEPPRRDESDIAKAFSGKPEFTQPDYTAWKRIQVNMSEADVLQVLGKPMEREPPPEKGLGDSASTIRTYRWVYGRINFNSSLVPELYELDVYFSKGRVVRKRDPFGAPLSTDGKPTIPRLIYPASGAIYEHYPRYLDLRWYPSSGQYPMHYVVEEQWGNDYPHEENGRVVSKCRWEPHSITACRVDVPYLLTVHVGANPGRWRVKAVNAIGESKWSEYREYNFKI